MRIRRGLSALTVTAGLTVTLSGCWATPSPPQTLAPEATPTGTPTASQFARHACTVFDGWGAEADPGTLSRAVAAAERAAKADRAYRDLYQHLQVGTAKWAEGMAALNEPGILPGNGGPQEPDARVEAAANTLAEGVKALDAAVGDCTDLGVVMATDRIEQPVDVD